MQRMVFSSTTTTVISLAATLANNAWTYSGLASCTMNTLDNSTDLMPHGFAVLDIPDTFAGVPTDGAVFDLFATLQDIDSTLDQVPAPDATAIKQGMYVCSFKIVAYDVRQTIPAIIDLHGIRKANFSLLNRCGQTASYTSGAITVKITPFTYQDAA